MTTTAVPAALDRIKSLLAPSQKPEPKSEAAEIDPRAATAQKLRDLGAERNRILDLIEAEEDRRSELSDALREKESARIDLLAEARLNGRDADRQRADELLADAAALRREIGEIDAVAARLRAQADRLNAEISGLQRSYKQAQGAFLDDLHEKLIEEYNAKAPELAETILQLAAVHRVMLKLLIGNSNGWDGTILLPGMHAGSGATIPAILQGGTQEFDSAANKRMADVFEALRAAGFAI